MKFFADFRGCRRPCKYCLLFLTKEVLYLLSYISISMILTVCGNLSLPAFLPPAGFTKDVLYLLSHSSVTASANDAI